jgi:hypothetical protein
MTTTEMMMQIEQLKADNSRLQQAAAAKKLNRGLTCKVSLKGAVSVYGMGRFPVTLYGEQWDRLFKHGSEIQSFITAHQAELKTKE